MSLHGSAVSDVILKKFDCYLRVHGTSFDFDECLRSKATFQISNLAKHSEFLQIIIKKKWCKC